MSAATAATTTTTTIVRTNNGKRRIRRRRRRRRCRRRCRRRRHGVALNWLALVSSGVNSITIKRRFDAIARARAPRSRRRQKRLKVVILSAPQRRLSDATDLLVLASFTRAQNSCDRQHDRIETSRRKMQIFFLFSNCIPSSRRSACVVRMTTTMTSWAKAQTRDTRAP